MLLFELVLGYHLLDPLFYRKVELAVRAEKEFLVEEVGEK